MDIAYSKSDFDIPVERSFFGSSHGKGPCDGIGAVVKGAVRKAVMAKKVILNQINVY